MGPPSGQKAPQPLCGEGVAIGLQRHITGRGGGRPGGETRMTDEDWAALRPGEREFAVKWLHLTEDERDAFCRQLLDAIEVLQRLRVFDGGPDAEALA